MYITSQCSISVPDATITMQILSWFLADVLNIRIVSPKQKASLVDGNNCYQKSNSAGFDMVHVQSFLYVKVGGCVNVICLRKGNQSMEGTVQQISQPWSNITDVFTFNHLDTMLR